MKLKSRETNTALFYRFAPLATAGRLWLHLSANKSPAIGCLMIRSPTTTARQQNWFANRSRGKMAFSRFSKLHIWVFQTAFWVFQIAFLVCKLQSNQIVSFTNPFCSSGNHLQTCFSIYQTTTQVLQTMCKLVSQHTPCPAP